jgi:hypothetical protein
MPIYRASMNAFNTQGREDPLLIDTAMMTGLADDKRVLENFLEDAFHDHRARMEVVRALGNMGCSGFVPALCKALNDAYPSVRHEAIIALGKIGGKDIDAYEALLNLLESESRYTRSIAARALIQISGVPPSDEKNLKLLIRLICSGDGRINDAVLQIGPPAIALLTATLEDCSFFARREAAVTLAMHIRRLIDQYPAGESIISWLGRQGFSVKSISNLYSYRITRLNGIVDSVTNSGFDSVSRTLCGDVLLRLSSEKFELPKLEEMTIDLHDLLSLQLRGEIKRLGRTLIADCGCGYQAIKLCAKEGDAPKLITEAQMQNALLGLGLQSKLPRPIGGLLRIRGLSVFSKGFRATEPYAICYLADSDYFRYLGDPSIPISETGKALASCAEDLGKLTRKGLIHTSLIPLFHNRGRPVGDNTYRWNRKVAGRLDDWLESCAYPNLRLSGIADLEHIEIRPKMTARDLQSFCGEHLLSMSLVLGSFFCRMKRFDERGLYSILKDCFLRYCCALAGTDDRTMKDALECIDWEDLAGRMAEEMDQHKDRKTQTAPHLGRFNGPFPIPELMRAIHITSIFAILELQARINATANQCYRTLQGC